MDEKERGLLDLLGKFNPLTGDYRKKTPLSVKTMKGATALTPLDSVVEIGKELKKEEPDYKKIGLLTAMEAAGAVAPMAKPAMTAVKSSKAAQPFKKTRKAYRIATQAEDGKLYPLFVNADDEIPVGQWISASIPPITFKGKNGNMYVPSKGAKRSKGEKAKPTGDMQVLPDQETADKLREAGFAVEKPSKAAPFGKVRAVASRPGYHATTKPVAHHLGPEDLIINEAEKNKLIKAGITPKAFKEKTFNYLDGKLISKKKIADLSEKEKKRVTKQKKFYVKRRAEDQVFLEVDMADDTSEELLSYMNARGRTDINDKLPEGGSYTYQDGQADAETWVVGGDMKVNRVLDRDEALTIQKKMGVKDLPLRSEVEDILERNFSNGGLVEEGIDMYQGQDDSLLVEGIGMAKGGTVEEQMEMGFGEVPDNTIGIDPVSGNEIPMGSTAENVRDDIPANLSEGEIVVAADVVNYHGVKLFEDLRAQAKMGYQDMAQDGRIGGEPMDDMGEQPVMGADVDIELSMEDLETTADMGQPESAFLGKFFSGLRESNKKAAQQSVRDRFKKAEERKSVDKIKKKAGSKKKKDKPKNNFEKLFGDRGGRNDDKKATPPTKKGGNLDLRFGGNPMERGARKFGPKDEKPEAGEVEEAYKGENLRSEKGFGQRFLEGLGYNEGAYAQKGGFDMEDAMTGVGSGGSGDGTQPLLEMREYMNDVGHRIFITFINGEPQMAIPDGYFPVTSEAAIVQQTSQGGGGGGGGSDLPTPEPFNYDELSMDELQEEVSNVVKPSITIIDKIGKSIHSKMLIKEIDRRLATDGIPIYEQEYLENLKTTTLNPEPSLLEKGLRKLTGNELPNTNPNLTGPTYDMLPNQYGVVEAYTPEVNEGGAGSVTRPEVTTSELMPQSLLEEIEKASREAAEIAFGSGTVQNKADPATYTPDRSSRDEQRRKERQETNKNMAGQSTSRKTGLAQSATRGLSSKQKSGGAGLDSRFGISGLDKGGLASKKKKSK